jgi:hypothetical protein
MSKFAVRGLVQSLGKSIFPMFLCWSPRVDGWVLIHTCTRIAQELRDYDICVNGYAPGTIQTDLGMCNFGFVFWPLVMPVFFAYFPAGEAEKLAGDKTVQEVGRVTSNLLLGSISMTRCR